MYPNAERAITKANVQQFCQIGIIMNFLAHLLLSEEKEGVIMGNFVGDFIKGLLTPEKTENWNQDYVVGLKLHRLIDSYTDHHPQVLEAKHRIALKHGKLAGIIVDIYFDYFLAKNFLEYSQESLWNYAHRMYALIENNKYLIPEAMIPMAQAFIRQDWLNSYETLEGIDLTFTRMSRREGFMKPIKNAAVELRENESFYEEKFRLFLPEIRIVTADFIRNNLRK